MSRAYTRVLKLGMACALLACAAGCMQLDTHVRMNEDGSVTVTEKLRFTRRLLDACGKEGSLLDVHGLLKKEAAEERAKQMGQGVTLVSYDVREAEEGAREGVAVYKLDDLNALHYVSPFPAYKDYAQNNAAKFALRPVMMGSRGTPTGHQPGDLEVVLRPLQPPKGNEGPKPGAAPAKSQAPADLQIYRKLQPMFREMLRDFKVRLSFEAYAPIRSYFGNRGEGTAPSRVDFIHVTDKDLDKFGVNLLENEEVLLDILRGELHSRDIAEHTKDWPHNTTLPVFLNYGSPWGRHGTRDHILFRPSLPLFKRHFEGQMLDFGENHGGKRLASFDEIGAKLPAK